MSHDTALTNAMALLIPLLAVAISLGALIVWIVATHRRRVREIDSRHKERMAAIERGLELPPEPHVEAAPIAPRARYLLRGLIWLGVGLAITLGGHSWLEAPMGGSGWIAVAVGVAYLIFYFVEGHKAAGPKSEAPPSDHAP